MSENIRKCRMVIAKKKCNPNKQFVVQLCYDENSISKKISKIQIKSLSGLGVFEVKGVCYKEVFFYCNSEFYFIELGFK
ncbi:hypothetical protein [Acinetobacter sp. CE-15]|uniref:hypothetical protein n=1 Tax=Acinetobacter sp. CE-15 TaxID=3425693 RepID=UPI003DA5F440